MDNRIKQILFLGTGTSEGVPVIGCDCPVCVSDNPKNKRTRTSILLELSNGKNILIDTSIDLRQQCLTHQIRHIDAVLFTHCHADHVFGIDELRRFNKLQQAVIPCYAAPHTADEIKRIFQYIFGTAPQEGGGIPKLTLTDIAGAFECHGLPIMPIPLKHGRVEVTGFRFENIAYLTDCSAIPETSFELLKDVEILILDALRIRGHSTHFNLDQAIETAVRIGAPHTYFTHMAHDLEHEATNQQLPPRMRLAYDGEALTITPPVIPPIPLPSPLKSSPAESSA